MVNGARIVPPSRYFLEPDLADQIEPPGHGPHDTAESHGDLVVGTPGLRRDAKIVVEALLVRQDPDRLTVCRDRLRPLSLATQGNAALVGVLGPLPLEPLLEPEARQEDDAEGGVCRSRLQPAPRPPGGRRSGRGNLSGVTLPVRQAAVRAKARGGVRRKGCTASWARCAACVGPGNGLFRWSARRSSRPQEVASFLKPPHAKGKSRGVTSLQSEPIGPSDQDRDLLFERTAPGQVYQRLRARHRLRECESEGAVNRGLPAMRRTIA